MRNEYRYQIRTEEIAPLYTGDSTYFYAGQVGKIVRNPGPNHQIVPFSEYQLGEVWGVTAEDAYNKQKEQIEAWITEQQAKEEVWSYSPDRLGLLANKAFKRVQNVKFVSIDNTLEEYKRQILRLHFLINGVRKSIELSTAYLQDNHDEEIINNIIETIKQA
jgi:hypothetical protein